MSLYGGFGFGDSVRPFAPSFWGTRLPDDAAIDSAGGPAVVADLLAQSRTRNPNLNVSAWTAEPLIVPASQPLVPVAWTGGRGNSALVAVLALGVPIPPGTRPRSDADAVLTIWQPDYVSPKLPGNYGRYYELHKAVVTVDAGGVEHWSANGAGRMTGVNTDRLGHFGNWTASGEDPGGYATDPDSTYELAGWGVQGSGLPYIPGVLTVADCRRGFGDHALQLVVFDAAPARVWPATRFDGSNSTLHVKEGHRLRFPPGYLAPAGVHPLCQLIVQMVRDYGFCVTDRTLSNLAVRAAPSVGTGGYLGSSASYDILDGFPWEDLQLLAVGSDITPTPTPTRVA